MGSWERMERKEVERRRSRAVKNWWQNKYLHSVTLRARIKICPINGSLPTLPSTMMRFDLQSSCRCTSNDEVCCGVEGKARRCGRSVGVDLKFNSAEVILEVNS